MGASGGSGAGSASFLVPGDVVEVTEGDLMNLQGKVVSVDGNTVTVLPRHEDLTVRHLTIRHYIRSRTIYDMKASRLGIT